MATHKVSELTGALLDAAVAKAEGWGQIPGGAWGVQKWVPGLAGEQIDVSEIHRGPLPWSTSWQHGGPIIERERIDIAYWGRKTAEPWRAGCEIAADSDVWMGDLAMAGATPLIAAMRAYVTSRFGDEVDLPD
jgi:hypothetical protein